MRMFSLTSALAFTVLLLFGTPAGAEDDYGYACVNCPTNWLELDIEDNNCGGSKQSPVAFSFGDARSKHLPRLKIHFGKRELVDPEFTTSNIEWGDVEPGDNVVRLDGETYAFQQFHFHTTAEHVINGERSDLEMHFVNKTSDGSTLVLAVFIKAGAYNRAFEPITDSLPGPEEIIVNLRALLPKKLSSFRYTGSTTTPPCSGGVEWNLLSKHVELSDDQIEAIRGDIWDINLGFDNNRPIQNRERRKIMTGKNSHGKGDDDRWDDDDDDD